MSREIKAPEAVILEAKSFDGEHTIEFNEGSHRYKMDGKPAVGTTTFLKAGFPTSMALISWFKSQTANALFESMTVPGSDGYYPREGFWPINEDTRKELFKTAKAADRAVTQEAADIGTICHSFAELDSLGKNDEAQKLLDQVRSAASWPLISACVDKYNEWKATNGGELVHSEALVGSPRYLFCGKIDRLDQVGKKLRLRDYKTSKAIFLDQFIQLGAYSLAIKEWLGLDVTELEILRFGKDDGAFQTMVIDDKKEIKMFQEQAIRCRYTYEFLKMNNDPRFKYGG